MAKQTITLDPTKISVLAELQRLSVPVQFSGEKEVLCPCPFHKDKTPSCTVNLDKRVFKCFACPAKGDFVTLLTGFLQVDRASVVRDLASRYGVASAKPIANETIERFHDAIWEAKPLLQELYNRGLTDESIRRFRLGYDADSGRITIPIPNAAHQYVNIRKYLPGAPGREKMKNLKGRGHMTLFPVEQLKYDNLIICGGEVKAIAVAQHMNAFGYGAVCATGGEGNWSPLFNRELHDKNVFVCFDIDSAGENATEYVSKLVMRSAASVKVVKLPLDIAKYPKGDINDYFGLEKCTAKSFLDLLEAAEPWTVRKVEEVDNSEPATLHLVDAMKPDNIGKRIKVKALIRALDITPYLVPSEVRCSCSRTEDCCAECPVFGYEPDDNGFTALRITPESPGILEMMGAPKSQQQDCLKEAIGVPKECGSAEIFVDKHMAVEDARVAPQLDIASRAIDREMMPAAIIGDSLELNNGYEMTGRVHPHPKTQQATLLISAVKPSEDALSTYAPSEDELKTLEVFRPKKWTKDGINTLLRDINQDLSANVTRIYEREDMHLVFDLAFHSPLLVPFDGTNRNGWVQVLVIGDSSQGKSDTAAALMQHYRVGEKVDCKNASVAGLLGGLQSIGNRFFVSWGVIPTHDARLVVLEELKGASTEVIGKLTDMRSSGIAEIPKIEKRRTRSRTRLIALSNPRSGMPMSGYNFGVEAVRELMGSAEDVRRFDAVCVVSAQQIDSDKINALQRHRPSVEHRFTSELCHRLILWAWTRNSVELHQDAVDHILDESTRMCNNYSETIPIVDRGSFRIKLAKLSAALAARTFSCTSDYDAVVVRKAHVEAVVDLLDRLYSDPACGYRDYSKSQATAESMRDRDGIRRALYATSFPQDLVNSMLATEDIEMRDICDWCGVDRGDAATLLSLLVRKGALRRVNRGYRKSPDMIALLREMRDSKDMKHFERPEFANKKPVHEDDEV